MDELQSESHLFFGLIIQTFLFRLASTSVGLDILP